MWPALFIIARSVPRFPACWRAWVLVLGASFAISLMPSQIFSTNAPTGTSDTFGYLPCSTKKKYRVYISVGQIFLGLQQLSIIHVTVNWVWRDLCRSGITRSWTELLRSVSLRIYFRERGTFSQQKRILHEGLNTLQVERSQFGIKQHFLQCAFLQSKRWRKRIWVCVCVHVHVHIHTVPVEGKHQFWWSEYW